MLPVIGKEKVERERGQSMAWLIIIYLCLLDAVEIFYRRPGKDEPFWCLDTRSF